MQTFGTKLRYLRRQKRMTQRVLADLLGFSAQSYINALETGKKQPTVQVVKRISQIFEVPIDHLVWDHLNLPDQAQYYSEGYSQHT
ncbi:MAG: hypothetical protein OHK0022_08870 [Roseiflexaceae bacterium]